VFPAVPKPDDPEPNEPTDFPDEGDDPVFWQRFERLFEHGQAFPADIALQLAAVKRIDTAASLKLLEKVRAKGLDAEVAAHILI
jgi:hypothetical protein